MRFFSIALFLFIFMLTLSFVNTLGLSYQVDVGSDNPWNPQGVIETFEQNYSPEANEGSLTSDIADAIGLFFDAFGKATWALPHMIDLLLPWLPSELKMALVGGVWVMYGAGIIEILLGRKP